MQADPNAPYKPLHLQVFDVYQFKNKATDEYRLVKWSAGKSFSLALIAKKLRGSMKLDWHPDDIEYTSLATGLSHREANKLIRDHSLKLYSLGLNIRSCAVTHLRTSTIPSVELKAAKDQIAGLKELLEALQKELAK
jgi:hypothetical protein